jgi:NAD-dependent dihydropyrimidine dehydrogenase PreA subunit
MRDLGRDFMDLRELLDEAIGKLPTADPERCVHGRAEVASCQRCVEACPLDAWVLDDEELGLDTKRCDGCGLCVAHCPEGALSLSGVAPAVDIGTPSIVVACERTQRDGHDWRLPCVHAVSLEQLTLLYRGGLRRISLQTADCSSCPRNDAAGIAHRVALLNRVLSQRSQPVIDLVDRRADRPPVRAAGVHSDVAEARVSRRGFFRRMMGAAAQLQSDDAQNRWRPPGEFLAPVGRGELALAVPMIDPDRCNGCDACVRICPHEALTLAPDRDAYLVSAESCTGCRLCIDVCDQDAVDVTECAVLEHLRVPLQERTCRSCGAHFHRPSSAAGDQLLCQVCSRVDHQRNLFQVL